MSKSLLEQLPEIVREGRRAAEKILESIEGRHKIALQTREIVIPNKDVAQAALFGRTAQHSTAQHSTAQHSTAQHSTIILKTGKTASSTATTYSLWRHCLRVTNLRRAYAAKLI